MREKSKYFKMNWSPSEFGFRLFIYLFLLLHVFSTFKVVFREVTSYLSFLWVL